MSESATLVEKVRITHLGHEGRRLYRLVEDSTRIASELIDSFDEIDYCLPGTLHVLSEAEMRLSELQERIHAAAYRAAVAQDIIT